MPGSAAVTAKYAKKRGCCQFVSAGTISSSRSRKTFANGSPDSGADDGSFAESSPGATCASTGRSATRSRYDAAQSTAA